MGFTYEEEKRDGVLETYEWDRTWWEHVTDATRPHVLLIGDSISAGYGEVINKVLGGEIYADGFRTSKALDNPYLSAALTQSCGRAHRLDLRSWLEFVKDTNKKASRIFSMLFYVCLYGNNL